MNIFGKPVSEYVSFTKWILWLIVIVFVARLALSLAGLPNTDVKWLSVTGAAFVGLVYCAVRVPLTGFGGYRHLLPLFVLQGAVANLLIAGAILLAMARGVDNIYSAPEYSGGVDGKTWTHAGAHLVLGIAIGPLVVWLVGAGIMFIVKKVSPSASTAPSAVPGGNPR